MSWKNILKSDLTELKNSVMKKLDDMMLGNFMIETGEYDDEYEGFRDASNFTYITFRSPINEGGSIEVTPEEEHEDDRNITVSFDLNFEGYSLSRDEPRDYRDLNVRLGSYTDKHGHYWAVDEWDDKETLEVLDRLLTDVE